MISGSSRFELTSTWTERTVRLPLPFANSQPAGVIRHVFHGVGVDEEHASPEMLSMWVNSDTAVLRMRPHKFHAGSVQNIDASVTDGSNSAMQCRWYGTSWYEFPAEAMHAEELLDLKEEEQRIRQLASLVNEYFRHHEQQIARNEQTTAWAKDGDALDEKVCDHVMFCSLFLISLFFRSSFCRPRLFRNERSCVYCRR